MKRISAFLLITILSLQADDGHDHSHGNDDKKKKQEAEVLFTKTLDNNKNLSKDLVLSFEKKCQACHDGFVKNKLAPPIIAVQQVYLRLSNKDMQKAQKRMVDFLLKPSKEKALMKPAVKLYKTMPNVGLSEKEAIEFSKLILETKFKLPDWFNAHFKSHKLKKPKEWK